MKKRAADRYGDKAGTVVDAYRKAYPNVKPVELLSRMFSVRTNAVTQAERKAALNRGTRVSCICSRGRRRSWMDARALSIAARSPSCSTTPTFPRSPPAAAGSRELAAKVSDAWINFARKGDPNHPGLPSGRSSMPTPAR